MPSATGPGGGRFSKNAAMPSATSLVVVSNDSCACIASSAIGSDGVSVAAIHAALPSRTAAGGAAASFATYARHRRSNVVVREDPRHQPDLVRRARVEPVADEHPVHRVLRRDVAGEQGAHHERPQPAVDLGQPERARSPGPARRRSPAASPTPPARHSPCTRATTGTGHSRIATTSSASRPRPSCCSRPVDVLAHDREVRAGAEDPLAGRGDQRRPGSVVGRRRPRTRVEHAAHAPPRTARCACPRG